MAVTENPILIQRPPSRPQSPLDSDTTAYAATDLASKNSSSPPLFLIHDGGGTVFSYFLLGALDRDVYGISNPYFGLDGEPEWQNGIVSMAERYAGFIRKTVSSGEILLGGWSLGGLVAIQLAHLLADDPYLTVKGIVMMDSHLPVNKPGVRQRKIFFRSGTRTPPAMVEKLSKSMDNARVIIGLWQPPTWHADPTDLSLPAPPCPPVILLRASEEQKSQKDANVIESEFQAPAHSGFEYYENFNLQKVINVPGDHFTIFGEENIDVLSERLKESCEVLS